MRIVSGAYRGRTLVAPKGHSTRPTADRTREALFNVLEHAAWGRRWPDVRVLDLFAGSGALGLEALSRGAAYCAFVDQDKAARAAIGANLETLACTARGRVLAADATHLGANGEGPFDVAFLDPPYSKGLSERTLAVLATGGWLADRALVVVERGEEEPALSVEGYELLDTRRWGAARVSFLRNT